jgi:hypothetical protein
VQTPTYGTAVLRSHNLDNSQAAVPTEEVSIYLTRTRRAEGGLVALRGVGVSGALMIKSVRAQAVSTVEGREKEHNPDCDACLLRWGFVLHAIAVQ